MDNTDYNQEGFTIAHDVVPLPTKGLFYKPKKESFKVGYLTAEDENILMSQNASKEGIVYTLLRNKIYEPGFNINQLLDVDVQAILIFLRNTSFGSEYHLKVMDPGTGKYFETTLLMRWITSNRNILRTKTDYSQLYFQNQIKR